MVVALVVLALVFSGGAVYEARSGGSRDTLFAALIGAIAGGLLAVLGGIAGSLLQNSIEERRQAQKTRAAIVAALLVVFAELDAAQTFLRAALLTLQTFPRPIGLSDAGFRSVAATLADGLPHEAWKALQGGYVGVALAFGVLTGAAGAALTVQAKDSLRLAADQVSAARDAAKAQLGTYRVVV